MNLADPNEIIAVNAALQKRCLQLEADNTALQDDLRKALAKIAWFEEQLRLARHRQFGRSSEKTSPEQGVLFADDAMDTPDDDVPAHDENGIIDQKKRPSNIKRNQFPLTWPRREIVHDIPAEDKVDTEGNALKLVGYDTFEQVKVTPAQHEVIIHKRPKYVFEQADGTTVVRQAPPVNVPLPKSFATPSLLADIITAKFVEHIPLHRYEQRCARVDFTLPRATQARWLIRLCAAEGPLALLVALLLDKMRTATVLHCDETRFQVFNDHERPNPDASLAYAWLLTAKMVIDDQPTTLAYYHYAASKSAEVIDELLGPFSGYLVTDGYSGFDRLARMRADTEKPITLCGCWDHARRRFKQAERALKPKDKRLNLTYQGVALVNKLYRIERDIKDKPPDEKWAWRQAHSLPALSRLKDWLDKNQPNVNPKSALGDAISYTRNQWDKLTRYVTDGHIPISNILCEQQAKKFAVGRANWMFANTPAGARASCMLYTLAVTACLNGVNPFHYFRYILAVLPTVTSETDLEALLPWRVDQTVIKDFDEFSLCSANPVG